MPIKSPVLCKASIALRALKGLLSGVMTYMSHQRTFLPEASHAVLTHVRFLVTMGPLMHLQSILRKMKRLLKRLHWNSMSQLKTPQNNNIMSKITLVLYPLLHLLQWYGLSSEWALMCSRTCPMVLYSLPHSPHLYLLSLT